MLLKVVSITLDDDASVIVGLRVIVYDIVIKTQRLHDQLQLQSYLLSKVDTKCYQLSGHFSNDGKKD